MPGTQPDPGAQPPSETPAQKRATFLATLPPKVAEQLRKLDERKAQIRAEMATREAAARLPPAPEDILRAEQAELARMERDATDEKAWADALAKYGRGRVARERTSEGTIILRVTTEAEFDAASARIGAEGLSSAQRTAVARELLLDIVVHPTRDRAREICAARPALWVKLYRLRDALEEGDEAALEGKA